MQLVWEISQQLVVTSKALGSVVVYFPPASMEEGLLGDDSNLGFPWLVASKPSSHRTGCCKWGV